MPAFENMNTLYLSDFSDIILGYNFRSAIEEDKNGNAHIIQAKNIIQGKNVVDVVGLTCISFLGARTAAFVRKHDILIVSRGTGIGSFRASTFDMNNENIIASGSIIIIRVKSTTIMPEYVCLYLNSAEGQKKILETLSGGTINTISPGKFREIEIPIISLVQQKNIVDLHKNLIQQEKIYNRKKELKQNILTATLKNLIHS